MIETGTVLQDRFLIEKELAHGGMGAVYLATDQKFGSRVAIKERCYEGAQLAEAFAREARILNCLHHPILPHVSDYFSEKDGHFLVMEYIEGEDLSEILKREGRAFPVEDVVRWMLDLLEGLDYLHSQDPPIVHRDIKPGNLKLTSRGNIVLLDFGLAKETSGNTQGAKSVFGYSRRYSPLEQIEGAGTDPRSDLFSLGATAFHLMTGTPPIDVLARASAIVAGKQDPLKLASEINPAVDSNIAEILKRALALDPNQRFASAREMRSAIESSVASEQPLATDIAEETRHVPIVIPLAGDDGDSTYSTNISDEPVPVVSSAAVATWPFLRRYRTAAWIAGILVAMLIVGFALSRREAPPETTTTVDSTAQEEATDIQPAPAAAETEQQGTVSEASPAPEPRRTPEVATLPNPSTDDEVDRAGSDDPPPPSIANEPNRDDIEFEEIDGELVPIAPLNRKRVVNERLNRRSTNERRRRQKARRASDDEPPVSSIEMIFTGVPPDRLRRRPRRYEPDR